MFVIHISYKHTHIGPTEMGPASNAIVKTENNNLSVKQCVNQRLILDEK